MLKKLTGIVADRKFYEESGVTVTLITSLTGGTAAVFGVPAASKGGPAKGSLVDMAVIETMDSAGGVASRNFGGAWSPVEGGVKLSKLEASTVAASAPRDPYTKPSDYVRKAASTLADEIEPTIAPITADASA